MGNITADLVRMNGKRTGVCVANRIISDDEIIKCDMYAVRTGVIMAKIKYECNEVCNVDKPEADRYEYTLKIDGDLVREIWYWKETKDYDVIIDKLGG